MAETLRHVEDMVDNSPAVDVHETFHLYQELLGELKAKIDARFELQRDPSTLELESYGQYPDGPGGSLAAYSGPEVDWMVHSYMENASLGFCNVHLTIWLGPQVKVPHFGLALGCFPQGWLYLDSVPRSYLVTDTDSFDRYYEPVNARWEQVRNDELFSEGDPLHGRAFTVRKLALGYVFDVARIGPAALGVGVSAATYRFSSALTPAYGSSRAA